MAADEPSENEERLRFVANAVPALLGYVDTGACYVWCNESYRRWFAYSPEELRGRHLRDVLGVSAWELLRPYAERALAGEEVTFESRVAYKRGPARDVRATYIPNKDSSGKVRGFVVLANDISEIRAAEQALRKSERMLERSQSTAHVGSFDVTLVDTDGERAGSVRWSDETFRMFGCEPGAFEVTHASFFEFIHPDDRERVRAGSPGKIQRALPFENDFRFVRADGVVRDMHTWTVFYTDATGRPIRMIGTCQDITERKRAEQELVEADRRKDEFLAMLSHELRNPLAPILNAIEIIERAGPGEEELRSTFQAVIARQVQHMKRLLDDLLDVSRVSRGKIELRKQPVELATLLRQAVEVSRPLLTEKRQQLAQKLGHEPMPLEADPTRVIQVFANILNNAAKFTPAGGHITLSSAVDAGNAVVKIRDDGAGMSDALLARAFELFAQETRAFDRAQGGLGIGLTLVKTLVKMHGGSVHAFSEGPRHRADGAAAARGRGDDARSARGRAPGRGRRGPALARAGGRRQRRRGGRDEACAAHGWSSGEGRVRRARRARRDGGRSSRSGAARHRAAGHGRLRGRGADARGGPERRRAGRGHRLRTGGGSPPFGRRGLHPSPRETRRRRPAEAGRRRGQRPVAGTTRSELISAFRSIQPSLKRKLEWNRAGAPSSA